MDAPAPIEALLAEREWVRHLARTLARDESAADDLEQEAWRAALERPPADTGGSSAPISTSPSPIAGRSSSAGSSRSPRAR